LLLLIDIKPPSPAGIPETRVPGEATVEAM